jgi:hypothetical protein
MNQNLLTHAQLAFERNDLYEASQLFRLLVTHYPDVSAGWLGLFQSSDDHAERIECLEQLLRLTHAERPAISIPPIEVPNDEEDEAFESIDNEPGSEFELIEAPEEALPLEIVAYTRASEPTSTKMTARQTQKAQSPSLVDEFTGTVKRLTARAEAELQPVVRSIKASVKDTVRTNSLFTTQFSTSYGRKLRRIPNGRLQIVPQVINQVWK